MKRYGKKRREADKTRRIPQSVRDEVFTRDGGRCTFVGDDGKRCNSPWNPEVDHIVPFAKGGGNTPDNLRLLCARHNKLEAERQYGKDHMEKYCRRE
jgi:5-methylcytosine-specific restriction endonuclease McrA